jgi:eukaryotic-like serine/threonine-protein kinase
MNERFAAPGDRLSTESWARVKAVFLAALDRPQAERSAFVAHACAGDAMVNREVEQLLASDEAAAGFGETPAAALLQDEIAVSEPAMPRLSPGSRLDQYEITGFVGAGGMGEVYRARDTHLHRDVAIKIVGAAAPDAAAPDAAARRRLLREARHASGLAHPGICTIHDVRESADMPFIVMAWIDGRPLREICRRAPLATVDTLEWGRQVADAIAHAHQRGLIHRDLKSSNVVIDRENRAVVLDFGLAKRLPNVGGGSATDCTQTLEHTLAGTLDYMPPEVLLGSAADVRSDIWALGVLLYEMATERLPFSGRTSFETTSAIISEPPAPLPRRVSLALRLVIERCLEKQPDQRYQSAEDVRDALDMVRRRRLGPVAGRLLVHKRRQIGYAVGALLAAASLLVGIHHQTAPDVVRGAPPVTTLAVLPVENASGDTAAQHLSEGITEALIAQIGSLGAVRVISRTSAERVANAGMSSPEIGHALGAGVILKAVLHRDGDRVRMDVRLQEAASGRELWSDTFDRRMRDVLVLQADIVRAVAGSISLTLPLDVRERLTMVRTVNPEAYEEFLKGRFHWNRRTEGSLSLAIDAFSRALALDPTYAPAHAALADCYNQLGTVMVGTGSPREYRPLAAAEAIKSLQIDPHSADAHAALGYVRHYEWHWGAAEQAFQRALELNPSHALARIWYANMLVSQRRFEEAWREVSLARELDPYSLIVNTNVGWVLQFGGRHEEAAAQLASTLELDQTYPQAHFRLSWTLAALGRHEAALRHGERAADLTGRSAFSLATLVNLHARAGRRGEAEALLAELLDMSRDRYVPPHALALAYHALGDDQAALFWTEHAFEEGSNSIAYLAVEPGLENLRGQPRFRSLLMRAGLE